MVPRRPHSSSNPIGDFITFRLMITPFLIQIVFWIGTLLSLGVGGRLMVASFEAGSSSSKDSDRDLDRIGSGGDKAKKTTSSNFSALMFAQGALIALLGPLILRIACELDIILFKMHDELKEMNDRARYRSPD